jgi:serine/threonine protein kinase
LHDKSIIHRDIKLDNILFKTNFNDPNYPFPLKLYLSDYGLARELKDMQADMPTYKVGTIFTMAPEIYEPGDSAIYTREVDIYSLGVCFAQNGDGLLSRRKNWRSVSQRN